MQDNDTDKNKDENSQIYEQKLDKMRSLLLDKNQSKEIAKRIQDYIKNNS